mgnify:CR=1 FL=1
MVVFWSFTNGRRPQNVMNTRQVTPLAAAVAQPAAVPCGQLQQDVIAFIYERNGMTMDKKTKLTSPNAVLSTAEAISAIFTEVVVAPGADVVILTPLAPHSLTVRPIVLPSSTVIEAQVTRDDQPYVLAYDGRSRSFERGVDPITFRFSRASHVINLVKLPEQHYFQTLRSKLMWGVLRHG